jgi:hypothetical protein
LDHALSRLANAACSMMTIVRYGDQRGRHLGLTVRAVPPIPRESMMHALRRTTFAALPSPLMSAPCTLSRS